VYIAKAPQITALIAQIQNDLTKRHSDSEKAVKASQVTRRRCS